MEVPTDASLADMVSYLGFNDFDPKKVRYEAPLAKIPSCIDLEALGSFKKCEIVVIGVVEGGETKMRVMTGDKRVVNTHSLLPSINHRLDIINEATILHGLDENQKTAYSCEILTHYPIFTDEGKFQKKRWSFRIHNHPSGICIPSIPDIRMSVGAELEIIVAQDGLAILQINGAPSEEIQSFLPIGLNSTRDVLYDNKLIKLVEEFAERRAQEVLTRVKEEAQINKNNAVFRTLWVAKNKIFAKMVGVNITYLQWQNMIAIQNLIDKLSEINQ